MWKGTETLCEYMCRDEVPRVNSMLQKKKSQTNRIAVAPFGIIFYS